MRLSDQLYGPRTVAPPYEFHASVKHIFLRVQHALTNQPAHLVPRHAQDCSGLMHRHVFFYLLRARVQICVAQLLDGGHVARRMTLFIGASITPNALFTITNLARKHESPDPGLLTYNLDGHDEIQAVMEQTSLPSIRQLRRYASDLATEVRDEPESHVIPKQWIVERTFSCISSQRCMSKEYERLAGSVETFIYLAGIRLLLSRL